MFKYYILFYLFFNNVLVCQNTDLFNLQGSNTISFRFEKKIFNLDFADLNTPLKFKITAKNLSDSTILIDSFTPSYVLLNEENLLLIEKGFSFCLFDSTGVRISPITHLVQPALPDSLDEIIIDTSLSESNYNDTFSFIDHMNSFNEAYYSYTKNLPKAVEIILDPNESLDFYFTIVLAKSEDNIVCSFPLEANKSYFLKLFYSQKRYIKTITSGEIDVSISDSIKLLVK